MCVLSQRTNPSNSARSGLESGTSSALLNGWGLYGCSPPIYDTHNEEEGKLHREGIEKEEGFSLSLSLSLSSLIVVVVGGSGVMFAPSDFTRHLRPIVPHGSMRPESGNNWLSTNKITTDKRVILLNSSDYSADVRDSIFLFYFCLRAPTSL